MTTNSEANEIHIVRMYDAPVQAVWDAWTDPAQVVQWWGPRGYSITSHAQDLRSGGFWRFTMNGPEGEVWENRMAYLEVVPQSKLVYDHGGNEDQPPMFRVSVQFEAVGDQTRLDMRTTLPSAEALAHTRMIIKTKNGNSTWDRLAEFLGKERDGVERFVINRSFDAPIGVMFDMWTTPDHIARWSPPTGAEMRFIRVDIRTGGEGFYEMTGPGFTMYGRTRYEEIRRPDRIVYTQQFCDKDGNISRHPFAPTWPETMRTVVQLSEEGPGCTRVTLTWEVAGEASAEEMATFTGARAGMMGGWTGSFDKLEAELAKAAAA